MKEAFAQEAQEIQQAVEQTAEAAEKTGLFAQPNSEAPQNLQELAQDQIETVQSLINTTIEFGVNYGFQVLGGIIVLCVGAFIAKFIGRFVKKMLTKQNLDITLTKFIVSVVKILIMTFVVIVALEKFGIQISPLIAGIGVIGFGTSFALQGTLSNYVAGLALIFTKPFKVGDIIEVQDVMGEVVEIKLPRTEIRTVDGNMIIIPNNKITGEIIHNYAGYKRIDLTVGVAYESDMDKAVRIVEDVVKTDERVYQGKLPKVGITEFADSSVNIFARLWCKQEDYWDTMFALNKKIFEELNKAQIVIPFPQRDVHLFKED